VVAFGRLLLTAHKQVVAPALKTARAKAVKAAVEVVPESDKTLGAALKQLGFRPDEIKFALASTTDKRADSNTARLKAAPVVLRTKTTTQCGRM
jgi:Holliday junction resolvasome RuvABC DNA-binding subunit